MGLAGRNVDSKQKSIFEKGLSGRYTIIHVVIDNNKYIKKQIINDLWLCESDK